MSSTSAPFVFQKINKIKEMDIKKIRKNILSCESSSEVRDELKKLNL
jgi:hypothetical protein